MTQSFVFANIQNILSRKFPKHQMNLFGNSLLFIYKLSISKLIHILSTFKLSYEIIHLILCKFLKFSIDIILTIISFSLGFHKMLFWYSTFGCCRVPKQTENNIKFAYAIFVFFFINKYSNKFTWTICFELCISRRRILRGFGGVVNNVNIRFI